MRPRTVTYEQLVQARLEKERSAAQAAPAPFAPKHAPARASGGRHQGHLALATGVVCVLLLTGSSLAAFKQHLEAGSTAVIARAGTVNVASAADPGRSAQGKPNDYEFSVTGGPADVTLAYSCRARLDEGSQVSDAKYRLFRINDDGSETEMREPDPENNPGVFEDESMLFPHGESAVVHRYRLAFISNGSDMLQYQNDTALLKFKVEIVARQVN